MRERLYRAPGQWVQRYYAVQPVIFLPVKPRRNHKSGAGINSPRNGGTINDTNTQTFGTCSTAKMLIIIGKVGYIVIIGNGKVTVSSRNGRQAKEFTSQSTSNVKPKGMGEDYLSSTSDDDCMFDGLFYDIQQFKLDKKLDFVLLMSENIYDRINTLEAVRLISNTFSEEKNMFRNTVHKLCGLSIGKFSLG
jgi:serine/threonine protein phosphatase PrpC